MKISQLFTKTRKEVPADETSKNAKLLLRAGYIHKEMPGVYAYLPLGLKVLENIKQIIREEMDLAGGQELLMTNLQSKETWQATTRWSDEVVDIWFKTKLKDNSDVGLAWSHEEPIMRLMQQHGNSYRDFPISVYQFQTKLRNELRAKSGVMRGREFVMKDMYSLHSSKEDLDGYYKKITDSYKKIFSRLGIGEDTFMTFASGGAFTKFSHEFQTICDNGEDTLFVDREKNIAVNEEVLDEATKELGIDKTKLSKVKSSEVGNIFNFGTEKSEQMGVYFTDEKGNQKPVYLASYGIGVSRLMGVIAEKFADDKGLVWPENIAPFRVYLVQIGDVKTEAESIYKELSSNGITVLYDDRDERPGTKFADADLLGIPNRVVVSPKTISAGGVELKKRINDINEIVSKDALLKGLQQNLD